MSKKPRRCDACNRKIRPTHHEFRLRDFESGQTIGRYHAACQGAATKYMVAGVALRATVYHPKRCGSDMEHCDGGVSERAA